MLIQFMTHVSPHPLGSYRTEGLIAQFAQCQRRKGLSHNRWHGPQHGQNPHPHIVHGAKVMQSLLPLLVGNIGQLGHHLLRTKHHGQLRIVINARQPPPIRHTAPIGDFHPRLLRLAFSQQPELLSHRRRQRVATRAPQIGHVDARRVGLPARSHARYHANVPLGAMRDEIRLRGDIVDGVNDHIPLTMLFPVHHWRIEHGAILLRIARVHFHHRVQFQFRLVRTDPPEVIAEHGRLGQSDILQCRHGMAIQTAQCDLIEIH
mmetsp:Transcript_44873/g.94141  ORF Transcript_44873/g.94141 Transcript_44873/m.94141 type:complete len:262 (-) Transcript_44873:365-1150(-)